MPNNITNILRFDCKSKKRLEEMRKAISGEKSAIDFNKIIPMPDNLPPDTNKWAWANWGTERNAYEVEANAFEIKFNTAWATPQPVIRKISEIFPDVTFKVDYADTIHGYYCGTYVFEKGRVLSDEDGDAFFTTGVREWKNFDYASTWYLLPHDDDDDKFFGDLYTGKVLHDKSAFKKIKDVSFTSRIRIARLDDLCRELSRPFVYPVKIDEGTRFKQADGFSWYVKKAVLLEPFGVWEIFPKLGDYYNGTINLYGQPSLPKGLAFPSTIAGDLTFNGNDLTSEIKLPDHICGELSFKSCNIPPSFLLPEIMGDLSLSNVTFEKEAALPKKLIKLALHKMKNFNNMRMPDSCKTFSATECKFPEKFLESVQDLKEILFIHCELPDKFVIPDLPLEKLSFVNMKVPKGIRLPSGFNGTLEFEVTTLPGGINLPQDLSGKLRIIRSDITGPVKLPHSTTYDIIMMQGDDSKNIEAPGWLKDKITFKYPDKDYKDGQWYSKFDYSSTWYLLPFHPNDAGFFGDLYKGKVLHDTSAFKIKKDSSKPSRIRIASLDGLCAELSEPFIYPVKIEEGTCVRPAAYHAWYVEKVVLLEPFNVWEIFSKLGVYFGGTINFKGQPSLPPGLVLPTTIAGDLKFNGNDLPSKIKLPDDIDGLLSFQSCNIPPSWKLPVKVKEIQLLSSSFHENISFADTQAEVISITGCNHSPEVVFPEVFHGIIELKDETLSPSCLLPEIMDNLSLSHVTFEKEAALPKKLLQLALHEIKDFNNIRMPDACYSFSATGCKFPEKILESVRDLEHIRFINCELPDKFLIPGDNLKYLSFVNMNVPKGIRLPSEFSGTLEFEHTTLPGGINLPQDFSGKLMIIRSEIKGPVKLPLSKTYEILMAKEDDQKNVKAPEWLKKKITFKDPDEDFSDAEREKFDYSSTWYLLPFHHADAGFFRDLYKGKVLHDKFKTREVDNEPSGIRIASLDGLCAELSEPFIYPVKIEEGTRVRPAAYHGWYVEKVVLLEPFNVRKIFSKLSDYFEGTIFFDRPLSLPPGLVLPSTIAGKLKFNGNVLPSEIKLPDDIDGLLSFTSCNIPPSWKLPVKVKEIQLLSSSFHENISFADTQASEITIEGCDHDPVVVFPEEFNGLIQLRDETLSPSFVLPETIGDLSLANITFKKGVTLPKKILNGLFLQEIYNFKNTKMPASCKTFSAINCKLPEKFLETVQDLKEIQFINCELPDNFLIPDLPLDKLSFAQMNIPEGIRLPSEFNGNLEFMHTTLPGGINFPKDFSGKLSIFCSKITGPVMLPLSKTYEVLMAKGDDSENIKAPAWLKKKITFGDPVSFRRPANDGRVGSFDEELPF